MFFNFLFTSSVFLVSAALADRRREHYRSKFLDRVDQSNDVASENVQYSTNWAGAVWSQNANTFDYITGTFTVPVTSGQAGSVASVWVGIDGNTCQNAILQTGINLVPDGNGGSSYDAWYEWYPDVEHYFSNIAISAGDTITLTVYTYSSTSGVAEIKNVSNGQSRRVELSSGYALCGQDAEWIVEDPVNGFGDQLPFANFGTVTFHGHAGHHKENYSPDGATIIDLRQNGHTLASVTTDGASVTIKHLA